MTTRTTRQNAKLFLRAWLEAVLSLSLNIYSPTLRFVGMVGYLGDTCEAPSFIHFFTLPVFPFCPTNDVPASTPIPSGTTMITSPPKFATFSIANLFNFQLPSISSIAPFCDAFTFLSVAVMCYRMYDHFFHYFSFPRAQI